MAHAESLQHAALMRMVRATNIPPPATGPRVPFLLHPPPVADRDGSERMGKSISAVQIIETFENMNQRGMNPGLPVVLLDNTARVLDDFITRISKEALARQIHRIPYGVGGTTNQTAFTFTSHQLLALLLLLDCPVDREIEINIDTCAMNQIQDRMTGLTAVRKRQQPIAAFASVAGNGPMDSAILNLPTGAGKTAISVAYGAALTADDLRWEALVRDSKTSRPGSMSFGKNPTVVRMVIFAATPSTYIHFKDTINRMMGVFRITYPQCSILLWDSDRYDNRQSIESARSVTESVAGGKATVIFRLIAVDKISKYLAGNHPLAPALLVVDELVEKNAVKYNPPKMQPLKQLVLQATPEVLIKHFNGRKTLFSNTFPLQASARSGQEICAPKDIIRLIENHQFTEAEMATKFAVAMRGMSPTECLRFPVLTDLLTTMPTRADVRYVECSYSTASASIMRLPHSYERIPLHSAVMQYLKQNQLYPTPESSNGLMTLCQSTPNVTDLIDFLSCRLEVTLPDDSRQVVGRSVVIDRLCSRIREFSQVCPLCLDDGLNKLTSIALLPCCGYAICNTCFGKISVCCFCRSSIKRITGENSNPVREARRVLANVDYSQQPTINHQFHAHTGSSKDTTDNLARSLDILRHNGYVRALIIVSNERGGTGGYYNHRRHSADIYQASNLAGFQVFDVSNATGIGTDFASAKASFDCPDHEPCALYSHGNTALLVGADLGSADSLVIIGDAGVALAVQAIGRVFRPDPSGLPGRVIQIVHLISQGWDADGYSPVTGRRSRDA